MKDIELVIKIPEELMEYVETNDCLSVIYIDEVAKAIANGIPLSKGHGRLIDENDLIPDSDYDDGEYFAVSIEAIKDAPTIIEANKVESEDME